jgi:hypothetical protein
MVAGNFAWTVGAEALFTSILIAITESGLNEVCIFAGKIAIFLPLKIVVLEASTTFCDPFTFTHPDDSSTKNNEIIDQKTYALSAYRLQRFRVEKLFATEELGTFYNRSSGAIGYTSN